MPFLDGHAFVQVSVLIARPTPSRPPQTTYCDRVDKKTKDVALRGFSATGHL